MNKPKELPQKNSSWIVIPVCTLATAVMLFLTTGLGDIWALAWIALMPLLWLAYGREPLWRVAIATFAAFVLGNIGFVQPFIGMPAATVAISLAVIGLAVAAVVAVGFARFIQRRCGWLPTLIAFPVAWTGIEYVVSVVSPNGTVGSLAYTQVGAPALIQSASLVGIWGVTFLICFVANGSALALRSRRKAVPVGAFVLTVFAANLLFGIAQLDNDDSARDVRVAVVAKDRPAQRFASTEATWREITAAYANEVHEVVAAHPGTSTIVLPEKLATLEPAWRDAVLAPIARAARDNHVQIVAGFEDDAHRMRNIAITFAPDGTTTTYVKRKLLGSEDDLTPGTAPGLLGHGMAVEICKDMDFPQMIRTDVTGSHVGLVFVPAEDFSIDRWMHARVAVMRGVEDGFSVVRSARKGELTVSDSGGQLLAIAHSTPANFVAADVEVPVGTGNTVYLKIGDLFAWICLGLSVAFAGLATRRVAGRSRRSARSSVQ